MNDDPAVMYLVVRKDHTYALAQLLSDGATAVCRVLNAYSRETMHNRSFEAWRGALYRKVTLRAGMKELAALTAFPSHAQGGVTVFAPCRRSERYGRPRRYARSRRRHRVSSPSVRRSRRMRWRATPLTAFASARSSCERVTFEAMDERTSATVSIERLLWNVVNVAEGVASGGPRALWSYDSRMIF